MSKPPEELNQLQEIPEGDDKTFCNCWGDHGERGCREPVKYKMVQEEWSDGESSYTTAFWCEKHKPNA